MGRGGSGQGSRDHPVSGLSQHPGGRGGGELQQRPVPGHLPGQRGARGAIGVGPGALLLIDEASMISNPDLADLISQAEARGAKVILA
ncbi:MAG: AAA family ATPase, partial [Streptosporangiaceae bacterium]